MTFFLIAFQDAGYGEKSFFAPDEEENEVDARKIDDEVSSFCCFIWVYCSLRQTEDRKPIQKLWLYSNVQKHKLTSEQVKLLSKGLHAKKVSPSSLVSNLEKQTR